MNLYLDALPELEQSFRKEAGFAARLSEEPANWPQELSSELLRQLPYLSDYQMNVNLMRVEPQRGFAFGYADITNRTERPEKEHAQVGIPHVRIPLIVQERAVKPFSVFLDGERVMPLNEERLRELLFNPQTFDLSSSGPQDPSLVDNLTPPTREGFTGGGETKTAAARDELLRLATKARLAGAAGRSPTKAQSYAQQRVAAMGFGKARSPGLAKAGARPSGQRAKGLALKELAKTSAAERPQRNHTLEGAAVVGGIGGVGAGIAGYASGHADAGHAKRVINRVLGSPVISDGTAARVGHSVGWRRGLKAGAVGAVGGAALGAGLGYLNGQGREKKASLLVSIAPTIREADAQAFCEKLAGDATLLAGFTRSGALALVRDALQEFQTKQASADERLAALNDSIAPSVVTVHKLPGDYFLVKSANVDAFAGGQAADGQVVDAASAAGAIGEENVQAMQPGQTATAVSGPVDLKALVAPQARVVTEFGEYLVQDVLGNKMLGWVFPQCLAWDGNFTPQPVAIFTNGSSYAVQDQVAGEFVGKSSTFPSDVPRGDGVFYTVENGGAICTAPVMLQAGSVGPDGQSKLTGTDLYGTPLQLSMQEGLKSPMRISDSEYLLPTSWKFMRLSNQTQLASDPGQMVKAAQVKQEKESVTLFFNGAYNLQGGCNLTKVASHLRYDMDQVQAEFMLGLLGVDGRVAKQKVAEARRQGSVKLAGLKSITTLSERYQESVKTAAALLSQVPDLRRDLTKEAAVMEDVGTVDNLLALNFINPENVAAFVGALPELEETSEKLAEMLLASYLGQSDLPEGALERGVKNMEEVISSLKALQQAEG